MLDAGRCLVVLTLATLMVAVTVGSATPAAPAQDDYLLHLPLISKPLPAYWARAYGSSMYPGAWANFSAVQELADGGLVLAGQRDFDRWLVRIEADGSIAWQKSLPGLGPHRNPNYPVGLSLAEGGGVVLASMLDQYVYEDERWYQDVVVLRMDAYGQLLWQKRYITNQAGDYVDIRATAGGYFVVANSRAFAAQGDQDDPWLLKLGESGEILWQTSYQNEGYTDQITAIDTTSDGGLLLAGVNGRSAGLWVFKVDGSGSIIWQKAFVAPGGVWACTPSWIGQTADQGTIVAGTSYQPQQAGGCLIKLTASGDLSWAKGYTVTIGEGFQSVYQMADGGYIVSGTVRPDPNDYRSDALLLRLNGTGEVLWSKRYGGAGDDSAYVARPNGSGYLVVGRTGSASAFEFGGLVMRVDGDGNIGNCDLVHPASLTSTNQSLVVSDTIARAIATAVAVDDPGLLTMDSQATMVQLCAAGVAAPVTPGGCRQ